MKCQNLVATPLTAQALAQRIRWSLNFRPPLWGSATVVAAGAVGGDRARRARLRARLEVAVPNSSAGVGLVIPNSSRGARPVVPDSNWGARLVVSDLGPTEGVLVANSGVGAGIAVLQSLQAEGVACSFNSWPDGWMLWVR